MKRLIDLMLLALLIGSCMASPDMIRPRIFESNEASNPSEVADEGPRNKSDELSGEKDTTEEPANDPSSNDQTQEPSIGVSLDKQVLMVDGKPFDIKAICWNPVKKGYRHPEGLAFRRGGPAFDLAYIERDIKLISEAGFNTVRPYDAIVDPEVLDLIDQYGIKIIVPAFNYFGTSDDDIRARIAATKDHPTTLFWEIGNEWNYNNFYNNNGNLDSSIARVKEVIEVIRAEDSTHPISTDYGEIPAASLIADLDVDLWGLNIYRSASFDDVFDIWKTLTDKPVYIGEYGADAIDDRDNAGRYAPMDQSFAAVELTKQIMAQYSSQGKGPVLGGAMFEFSDEWWKDGNGSADTHDIGGIAPGGGPYPDRTFNEEWWGIVDIDRKPRPAYEAMKALYKP